MKKILVFGVLLLMLTLGASSQETFRHRWNIGESLMVGGGSADRDFLPLLGAELNFSHRVSDTRWRWGVAPGLLFCGAEYEDETEEEFLRAYGHFYVKGYVDYAFSVPTDKLAFYLHGGIAPSWLMENMNTHLDRMISAMGELGVGMDGGFARMALNVGFDKHGLMGVYFSFGLYFGKK